MDVDERAELLPFPGVGVGGIYDSDAEGSVGAAVSVWKKGSPIACESFGSKMPININFL